MTGAKRDSWGRRLRLSAALLVVVVSVVWRVIYRGRFYVGWDTLGAAQGQWLLATRGVVGTVQETLWSTRHYGLYWSSINSVPYVLIAGGLGTLVPSEFWAHGLSFVLGALALVLLARAAGVTRDTAALFLLGIASSGVLLSYSVVGYAYISGTLPHASALAVTQSPSCRRRWTLSLALAVLTMELSWHLHPLGKTHFVVFLAGACLLRGVPPATRAVWALVALAQVVQLHAYDSATIVGHAIGESAKFFEHLGDNVWRVVQAIYLSGDLDVPVLALVGLGGFVMVEHDALFFRAVYLAQLAPLLTVVSETGLPARRIIVLQFYDLLMLGLWLRALASAPATARGRQRRIVLALVGVGALLQLTDLWRFTRTPITAQHRALPHTQCEADSFILPPLIAAADHFADMVAAGKKLVLVYNYAAYPENTTDPTALLERLYNRLGHSQFVESIRVFGSIPCRYSCVPVTPLDDLEAGVVGLAGWGDVVAASFGGMTNEQFNAERQRVMDALAARYALRPLGSFEADPPARFTLYALDAK